MKNFLPLNLKNEKIIIGSGTCIHMLLKENNVDLIIFAFQQKFALGGKAVIHKKGTVTGEVEEKYSTKNQDENEKKRVKIKFLRSQYNHPANSLLR